MALLTIGDIAPDLKSRLLRDLSISTNGSGMDMLLYFLTRKILPQFVQQSLDIWLVSNRSLISATVKLLD